MRLLWWSAAPWCGTGYGNQAKLALKRIEALGHELAVCAYRGIVDTVTTWEGTIQILPKATQLFAEEVVCEYARRFSADATISLLDVWPLHPGHLANVVNWCPIVPIDTDTLPESVSSRLRESAHMPIAMSQHGKRAMHDADIECRYIPHAYDGSVFYPVPRTEAREALGWPQDRFMVTMVAANLIGLGNPNRKCFGENFEAFATLRKRHKEAFLYAHTIKYPQDALGGGTDLVALAEHHGIADAVYFPDELSYRMGMPSEYLRNVYSASDVLLSASAGEGFGVPIIEAQACGCPVIVGDWSAMGELVGGGWKIDKSEAHPLWTMFNATWHLPSPGAIADRLERAYQSSRASRATEAIKSPAVSAALDFVQEYEVENVVQKYWKPFLNELAESVPRIAELKRTLELEETSP